MFGRELSRGLSRALFGSANPIGQRVDGITPATRGTEVIGVVEDVAITPLGEIEAVVYHPHDQLAADRNWTLTEVVKTDAPMPALSGLTRQELAGIDPELVVHDPRALTDVIGDGRARQRFAGILLATFASLALLLACLGVSGVLAFTVVQRRREIGVRMALGASRTDVARMVLQGGLSLTGAGVVIGTIGALALTGLLSSLLFEVSPTDSVVLFCAPVMVLATGQPAKDVAEAGGWLDTRSLEQLLPAGGRGDAPAGRLGAPEAARDHARNQTSGLRNAVRPHNGKPLQGLDFKS